MHTKPQNTTPVNSEPRQIVRFHRSTREIAMGGTRVYPKQNY